MDLKIKNSSALPKNKEEESIKRKQATHKYTGMFHSIIYRTERRKQIICSTSNRLHTLLLSGKNEVEIYSIILFFTIRKGK